jgi:hypothetical protein
MDIGEHSVWQGPALTLDDAMAQVQRLGLSLSGQFVIHSRKTGVEVCMMVARSAKEGAWFKSCSNTVSVRYRAPADSANPTSETRSNCLTK